MQEKIYDIVVIGGGINGMGIARDAAGRGLSVLLLEQNDFASATSSSSTKLIHGGLRYLEYYEFGLVRAALSEREVLLDMAPHIIWPLEFILPHCPSMRPAWLVRLGLFLYDHLGGRKKLAGSKSVRLDEKKINSKYKKGFSYSDCWVDDARLVVLNAIDAAEQGAELYNYTPCEKIECKDGLWEVRAGGVLAGQTIKAKQLVNAAGPWVRSLLDDNGLARQDTHEIRLVKGSHIITKRLFEGDECYILQQPDGRIVFIIPYEDEYSLIGTTDVEYEGDPSQVEIDDDEIDYLCKAVNEYSCREITKDDVVSTYSGVRPLLDSGEDDASAVTRDYILEYDEDAGAPLLSIFGGKITTYRVLAEKAVAKLTAREAWTKGALLPGGLARKGEVQGLISILENDTFALPHDIARDIATRWSRQYGGRAHSILECKSLGQDFGYHLYQAEVDYLIEHEYATSAQDILWRRTKLGLKFSAHEVIELSAYIEGAKEKRSRA